MYVCMYESDNQFPKLYLSAKLGIYTVGISVYVRKYQCKLCWQAVKGLVCTSDVLSYNVAGRVLRHRRLSAVKKSEADLRLS